MNSGSYAYIVVYSTSHALMIEKLLQEDGVGCQLVPVPRHISSDCGVCVRIDQVDASAAEEAIRHMKIEIAGMFMQ
jgi:hypothetical protein